MKVFNTGIRAIVFIIIISSFSLSIITVLFTQSEVSRATDRVIQEKESNIAEISSRVELRLQDATRLLQLAAKAEDVRNVLYANSVSEQYKGLPPDMDIEKKQVAKDLLKVYQDFETVAFILPNGDIYFIEPYTAQQNLPRLNFAYREWYQGVIATGDAHVGEAVISAATGHRVVPIAVPVYPFEDSTALAGILVGALDLDITQQKLRESTFGPNEYVLITDHKGSIIADSRIGTTERDQLQSALNFGVVNSALSGMAGSKVEIIEGIKDFETYRPLHVGTSNWAIVSFQPYNDTFFTIDQISSQSLITVALITLVSGVSGYFLYRSFKSNNTLTHRLGGLNEELKAQTAKLKELDKEKEEFSAMITHELKTPLVPVIGYSELLMDGTLGELSAKQKEKIQVIHSSASSLSRLISDLLDARKLELGKIQLDICNASVKEMVEHCVAGLALTAQSKRAIIIHDIEQGLEAKCDLKRIEQVLYNLVMNAIKFVPPGSGKIEISAVKQTIAADNGNGKSSYILVTVKDNGLGIPNDKQQNLFKKFYQVDTSLSRRSGGTGLGLAISKGLIEAHGGKIWFESEGEGKGSIFSFTIPCNDSQDNVAAVNNYSMSTVTNRIDIGSEGAQ